MWIFYCVCINMVHSVHNAIGIGTYIAGALSDETGYEKEFLPERRHGAYPMRAITVQKK